MDGPKWSMLASDRSHGVHNQDECVRYRTPARGECRVNNGTPHPQVNEVVMQWMGSQGHRDNIVKSDFTQIGIGVAIGKVFPYWCTIFH